MITLLLHQAELLHLVLQLASVLLPAATARPVGEVAVEDRGGVNLGGEWFVELVSVLDWDNSIIHFEWKMRITAGRGSG